MSRHLKGSALGFGTGAVSKSVWATFWPVERASEVCQWLRAAAA
jgi:hypothetical protein